MEDLVLIRKLLTEYQLVLMNRYNYTKDFNLKSSKKILSKVDRCSEAIMKVDLMIKEIEKYEI